MLKQFFIAAALGLSGLAAVSGFEPAPVYTPENFSKEYRDAIRKEIPAFLQKTEKSLKALNADFAKAPASEIQKERFTKRMEIAEKLLALMKKDAGSENPDAPLKELGEYLDPPVGKSGVNHRLRKLSELADRIRT